jgi:hypothetical protein
MCSRSLGSTSNEETDIRLEEQIRIYLDAPRDERGKSQRLQAARKISDILLLESDLSGTLGFKIFSPVVSRSLAQDRRDRGARDGEPICQVRCQSCRRVALFRLDLRETSREGDLVYRIPGLCYENTVENGVGLVLKDGRITGRMLYGPPACDCSVLQTIEIL